MNVIILLLIAFLNTLNAADEKDPLLSEAVERKTNSAQEVPYEKTYIGALHKFLFPDAPIFNQNNYNEILLIQHKPDLIEQGIPSSYLELDKDAINLMQISQTLEFLSNVSLYASAGTGTLSLIYPEAASYYCVGLLVAHKSFGASAHAIQRWIRDSKTKIKIE